MSSGYVAVGWNPQKKTYDRVLTSGILCFLGCFWAVSFFVRPEATLETLLIRGFGVAALVLLHIILMIGPLCRLDRRFLPLLYNRRHLGVSMFFLGLAHGGLALFQFHALGDVNPFVSLFSWGGSSGLSAFPFQPLGFLALCILFLMAATSHDFWLAHLTAPVWKRLHLGVYVAYALLIAHVALGSLQVETNPVPAILLGVGLLVVIGLHLKAAFLANVPLLTEASDFVPVCSADEIALNRAKIVEVGGERVAIFRHAGGFSAVSNVCQHQNGPLGEGKIVDGCITCPWHGYQYRPQDGAAPAPFTEKLPTFKLRVSQNQIWIDPTPNPPGTYVEPAPLAGQAPAEVEPFYIGYLAQAPAEIRVWLRKRVMLLWMGSMVVSCVLALSQSSTGPGVFEYGVIRSFEGTVVHAPYPMLRMTRPGRLGSQPSHSLVYLTVFGKKGADPLTTDFEGKQVRLQGSLIYRDNQSMIEVQPESVVVLGESPRMTSAQSLGQLKVQGEIVDSKCYLGVMKPGNLLTHKACAIRCISGGVPPVLLVRNAKGLAHYFLLVDPDGRAVNKQVLDLVAEPITIEGEVQQRDNQYYLVADPATYQRMR